MRWKTDTSWPYKNAQVPGLMLNSHSTSFFSRRGVLELPVLLHSPSLVQLLLFLGCLLASRLFPTHHCVHSVLGGLRHTQTSVFLNSCSLQYLSTTVVLLSIHSSHHTGQDVPCPPFPTFFDHCPVEVSSSCSPPAPPPVQEACCMPSHFKAKEQENRPWLETAGTRKKPFFPRR